jgi:hypothetical protein
MALFRRNRPVVAASPQGIEDFWVWWAQIGARDVAAAVAADDLGSVEKLVSDAVEGVHPGLAWEVGSGSDARNVLVVTAAGDPRLRAIARRWLRLAPTADPVWEYTDTRPPARGLDGATLDLDGRRVALREITVGWQMDEERARVDVLLHHPALAAVPEEARTEITLLVLDHLLGEEAVELWLGAIAPSVERPEGATGLESLRDAVRALAAQHSGPEPTWQLIQARTPSGQPVLAAARVPLSSAVAPELDEHVRVELPYPPNEAGLPDDDALQELRDLEDRIEAVLGRDGQVVAHETSGGQRTLHVYVDRTTDAHDRVLSAISTYPFPQVRTTTAHDPDWSAVGHLRG